jgi:hypothetical protein
MRVVERKNRNSKKVNSAFETSRLTLQIAAPYNTPLREEHRELTVGCQSFTV